MKLHTDFQYLTVEFESIDWNTGVAKTAMALIKAKKGFYNGATKRWRVRNDKETKQALLVLQDKYAAMVDMDEFDVNQWLEETFEGDEPKEQIIIM